jgi:hypothetical protein
VRRVRREDLIKAKVNFDAPSSMSGFYWTVRGECPVWQRHNISRVFEPPADGGGWYSQSATALFKADANGDVRFGITVEKGGIWPAKGVSSV